MKLHGQKGKIAVVGGDMRQIYMAVKMADMGHEVAVCGFDEYKGDFGLCTRCRNIDDVINNTCAVILPIPVTNDGKNLFMPLSQFKFSLDEIVEKIGNKTLVLGGRTEDVHNKFREGIIDYFDKEELVIANAYLTAESAVSIAMQEMNLSLNDMNVLVMGYGRIGKCLCHLLKSMGANVYASARKETDFAWIRAYGYSPVDTSKVCDVVSSCKLIFNTIPKLVLGENVLSCLPKDCFIIDLASKPGGIDFEAAKKCGLRTVWALGLPGKKLPESAGNTQAKVILDILEDKGLI